MGGQKKNDWAIFAAGLLNCMGRSVGRREGDGGGRLIESLIINIGTMRG